MNAGVLGTGQEACPAKALSIRQLAHLLFQVHQGELLLLAPGLATLSAARWVTACAKFCPDAFQHRHTQRSRQFSSTGGM
eukprot:scaffold16351_cov14-Tisochrysis_lutea.AAC.1